MRERSKNWNLLIFAGDVVVFYVALWVTLLLRNLSIPEFDYFRNHLFPFSLSFAIWLLVFFIAGLYDRKTIVFRKKLLSSLWRAQFSNSIITVILFYFIPYFSVNPRTNMFINLVITLILISVWRSFVSSRIYSQRGESTLVIGEGRSVTELKDALNQQPQFGMNVINPGGSDTDVIRANSTHVVEFVKQKNVRIVILNLSDGDIDPIASDLYKLLFTKVEFLDFVNVYEEVFGREPLDLLHDKWFLQNISLNPKPFYTLLKRLLDLVISIPFFTLSLFVYPFVILAQQAETRGPLFYKAMRVGQGNVLIPIIKFRSMTGVDADKPDFKTEHEVTRVGRFLRRFDIDETPQIWSVIKGDMSLIGPRSEFPALVNYYASKIPFYNVRHTVTPGISGWAQINDYAVPREKVDVEMTMRKLSYDLYYIKNRSFILDLKIALKTIKTLLSRVGS